MVIILNGEGECHNTHIEFNIFNMEYSGRSISFSPSDFKRHTEDAKRVNVLMLCSDGLDSCLY